MSDSNLSAVLRAGGLVDAEAAVPTELHVDEVSARAYRHPSLGDREVVRITPSALAAGVDVEMEVIGFGSAQDLGVVGKQKRRSPGFPGWALIHDPEHAAFALKVMDSFRREARRARTKPGHAKTGIDAIASELGRSVPHFLPSYYEEAGRAFLEAGTVNYAAQCFGKARDAERVHALEVDEELRHESFVEFALAGAVTIKAIAAYAKELSESYEPGVAHQRFTRLCIQRTLGGLPPWSGMARELRRLAKAAKLDVALEDEKLIAEIIESPALAKAPGEFWKVYRKPVVKMARSDARLRGLLLNLFPTPNDHAQTFDEFWLEFLGECGALDAFTEVDPSPEVAPSGGASAWVARWLAHIGRDWRGSWASAQTFALLRRSGKAIASAEEPLVLRGGRGVLDLDVFDLLLELDVSIVIEGHFSRFELGEWAIRGDEDERGRDPSHVVADPHASRLLDQALDRVMGEPHFEMIAKGKPSLAMARRRWLEARIKGASDAGVPALIENQRRLESATSIVTFAEFPKLYEPMKSVGMAGPLAVTLRGGILDEIGWDAIDEAIDALGKGRVRIGGAFPFAVVFNQTRAIVVGPGGRLMEHDLALPSGTRIEAARYAQGQLMVIFKGTSYEWRAYWSGSPSETFKIATGWPSAVPGIGLVLENGAVTEGGKALHAGDRDFPAHRPWCSDGETVWALEWDARLPGFRELDPLTGKLGRSSRPRFLEEFTAADCKLDALSSFIRPLPEGRASSPLGSADGMVGMRVRDRDLPGFRTAFECEDIVGRRAEGQRFLNKPARAFLDLPGHERPRLVGVKMGFRGSEEISLHDESGVVQFVSGELPSHHAGSRAMFPTGWWHLYDVRDPEGSRALRDLTDDDARALLRAAVADIDDSPSAAAPVFVSATKELRKRLPALTHPRLSKGVIGIVGQVAALERQHARFAKECDASALPASALVEHVDDTSLRPALGSIVNCTRWGQGSATQQLLDVSAFFQRTTREPGDTMTPNRCLLNWADLLLAPRAIAYLAASVAIEETAREPLVRFLRAFSLSIFAEEGHAIRRMTCKVVANAGRGQEEARAFEHQGNDYLALHQGGYHPERRSLLEHAPDGVFRMPPDLELLHEKRIEPLFLRDAIERFLGRLEEKGPVEWDAANALFLSDETGLGRAEAKLLWAGLPGIENYESSFLDKRQRALLELKVTEADAARGTFRNISARARAGFLHAAVADDPTELWNSPRVAHELARAWIEKYGRRARIPEDLLISAKKAMPRSIKPAVALGLMADPGRATVFHRDTGWKLGPRGQLLATDPQPALAFDAKALSIAAHFVPFLFDEQPVGDPIRKGIPTVLEGVRERLRSEELILPMGSRYFDGADFKKQVKAFLDGLGGKRFEADEVKGVDAGKIIGVDTGYGVQLLFRPAVVGPGGWEQLTKLASGLEVYGSEHWQHCALLLSDGYGAMASRVLETPVPEGGFEANPMLSVPELLEEVASKFDLSSEASALYLQSLALLAPTRKNVLRWNGWKAAQYTRAAAELMKRELLVEAKRARAGRKHFLPGGWEALASPRPPLESWKMPLHGLWRCPENRVHGPMTQLLLLRPTHEIFGEAWRRVQGGDPPRYEEVTR